MMHRWLLLNIYKNSANMHKLKPVRDKMNASPLLKCVRNVYIKEQLLHSNQNTDHKVDIPEKNADKHKNALKHKKSMSKCCRLCTQCSRKNRAVKLKGILQNGTKY